MEYYYNYYRCVGHCELVLCGSFSALLLSISIRDGELRLKWTSKRQTKFSASFIVRGSFWLTLWIFDRQIGRGPLRKCKM